MNVRELIAILQTTNQEATVVTGTNRKPVVYYNSEQAVAVVNDLDYYPDDGWQLVQAPEQWKSDTRTKDAALAAIDICWAVVDKTNSIEYLINMLEQRSAVQRYLHELPLLTPIRKKVIRDKINKLFMEYIDSKE